jgi:hypothetical protein
LYWKQSIKFVWGIQMVIWCDLAAIFIWTLEFTFAFSEWWTEKLTFARHEYAYRVAASKWIPKCCRKPPPPAPPPGTFIIFPWVNFDGRANISKLARILVDESRETLKNKYGVTLEG